MDAEEGLIEQVPWSACFAGESKENRPRNSYYKVQNAFQHMVWWVQFNDQRGCSVQCREEASWNLLIYQVIQTDPKNCEYVIISGAQRKTEDFDVEDAETFVLAADEEKGKLSDPFYRLEHQEVDLRKKKEAEPVLVRLQRVADNRHSDDYALNKALRARLRSQNKRVAQEEAVSKKMGLGIRLLPASEEDSLSASRVKFSSKFERNRRDKRAAIFSASIFSESMNSDAAKKRQELVSKRRKINAPSVSTLVAGRIRPSSMAHISSQRSSGKPISFISSRK